MTDAPKVYQAIANVTEAISKDGVAKSRKNPQQGYAYRGIDEIYNALAPELAKHKLCILPQVMERTAEDRTTAQGKAITCVTVRVAFDFVSAEDGSTHRIVTVGEAMDLSDKATNKAMSAAYKYAAMMAFCIPTAGEDSESETHETQPSQTPQRPADAAPRSRAPNTAPPPTPHQNGSAGSEEKQLTLSQLRDRLMKRINQTKSPDDLDALFTEVVGNGDLTLFDEAHPPTANMLRRLFDARKTMFPPPASAS